MTGFIKIVQEHMQKKNLSLRQVARFVGIDPSFLSKVLLGKRNPPSNEEILKKFAELFEVEPIYLIFSAGLIPSNLQSKFENPKFIQSFFVDKSELKTQPIKTIFNSTKKKANISQEKTVRAWVPKSSDLSVDLL